MSFLAGLLVKKPELRWHSKQLMSIMIVISANNGFNKFVVIALQKKINAAFKFDKSGKGSLDYREFCNMMNDQKTSSAIKY